MDHEEEYDLLTSLVHKWIKEGCPGDLIKVVDKEIAKSKEQLRKKIELLSRDVDADRLFLSQHNIKAVDTASHAVDKMTVLQRQVLPLLEVHLEDLLSLEMMCLEKKDKKIKEMCDKQGPQRLPSQEVIPIDEDLDDIDTDLIVTARSLTIRDLFEDMPVGSTDEEDGQEDETTFKFPVCRVSKSCMAVVDLVMQALDEAEFCDDDIKKRKLVKTSYKVLHLFSICFQLQFKEDIDSIPTATALFHNNCMFVAHFILTSSLTREAMEDKNQPDFSSLLKKFRSMGEEAMRKSVEDHRIMIVDFFQRPEVLQSLIEVDVKNPSLKAFEWTVKKTILLLRKLQSSWSTVLPLEVYNQMMASLMTVVLEEMMNIILAVEDFSASTSDAVVVVMKSVRHDLPQVLEEPHSGLASLIPNAFQFLELERLLSSSLTEIVNRWGSGFGPLSVAFSCSQVKRLIRALFQNNQLRANALEKIQDL